MSVLGHVAIGVVVARRTTSAEEPGEPLAPRMLGLAALALLPDVDFLLHDLFPRVELIDHRGATHSLAFALLVGVVVGLVILGAGQGHPVRWGVIAAGVVASHGIMDTFGQTDLGVELLWPFSDVRLLAPWHILPNPSPGQPIVSSFLIPLGLELLVFQPAWLDEFWPRRPRTGRADG
jgi:inner membrane protein